MALPQVKRVFRKASNGFSMFYRPYANLLASAVIITRQVLNLYCSFFPSDRPILLNWPLLIARLYAVSYCPNTPARVFHSVWTSSRIVSVFLKPAPCLKNWYLLTGRVNQFPRCFSGSLATFVHLSDSGHVGIGHSPTHSSISPNMA